MAFVRWKKTQAGTWKAYLVHSYRDDQGTVRHRHLAYLGDKTDISPELLESLKERHKVYPIKWHAITKRGTPKRINVSQLNDAEIIKNLRAIRRAHGLGYWGMAERLEAAGAPPRTYDGEKLSGLYYKWIEESVEGIRGKTWQNFYEHLERDLAPAVRKAFSSA